MPSSNGARKRTSHDARHDTACVYRVHDRLTNVLLYVGCTNDPERRQLEHHFTLRYRRDEVRYEVDPPMAALAAIAEKRRQIAALNPLDNERGRPSPATQPRPNISVRLACAETWDARTWCQAWGTRVGSHGCRHDPGHTGGHECACGNRPTPNLSES